MAEPGPETAEAPPAAEDAPFPGADPAEAWPDYCDPDYVMPETIEVAVPSPGGPDVVLSVDIARATERKRYLGGYRHKKTGKHFHHASSQSVERGLLPPRRDVEGLRHRDTQTCETKTRSCQSTREYGTQMARCDVIIDEADDKPVAIKRYFTAAQLSELQRQKTLVIQCYWRGFCARRRTWSKEVERRVHPRTQADFELLYNELEAWRSKEMAAAAEKGAEARADVLARETKALQTIDRLKARAARDGKSKRIARVMELMALPKKWEGADGELQEVHTPFTTRALELRDLYRGLNARLALDDRLQVLRNVKWTVEEFPCALTRDIVELCDREADLLNRGRHEKSMESLRKRVAALFRQFVETPDFNPESTRFLKVPTLRQQNTIME